MIKKLLSLGLVFAATEFCNAQAFSLVYEFSNVTSTSGTVDPTPTPTAVGVSSGSFMANGLSANPTTTNVFAFTGWPTGATNGDNATFTGALDANKNFEVTLTPGSGYEVSLSSISFYTTRSGTGPRHWAVRSNKDGFAANLPASTALINASGSGSVISVQGGNTFFWSSDASSSSAWFNNCQINLSGANFTGQTTPYTFRWHAWNAEGANGSWRIDSVVINGTASISTGLGKLTHDLNAKFKLYPNPSANGVVTVEAIGTSATKVEVINLLGAVVATQNTATEEKIRLDVANLPAGTYFVRVTSGKQVTTEKLIISE